MLIIAPFHPDLSQSETRVKPHLKWNGSFVNSLFTVSSLIGIVFEDAIYILKFEISSYYKLFYSEKRNVKAVACTKYTHETTYFINSLDAENAPKNRSSVSFALKMNKGPSHAIVMCKNILSLSLHEWFVTEAYISIRVKYYEQLPCNQKIIITDMFFLENWSQSFLCILVKGF